MQAATQKRTTNELINTMAICYNGMPENLVHPGGELVNTYDCSLSVV